MNISQQELDKRLLAQWERLWLDPDWDTVYGYRKDPCNEDKTDEDGDKL